MNEFSGIDLHSNNSVVVISDEADRVVYQRRLPNHSIQRVAQTLHSSKRSWVGISAILKGNSAKRAHVSVQTLSSVRTDTSQTPPSVSAMEVVGVLEVPSVFRLPQVPSYAAASLVC